LNIQCFIQSFENQEIGAQYTISNVPAIKSSAYVDDINEPHTDSNTESLDSAMARDPTTWKNNLYSSSGDLSSRKCYHYKICWVFQATGQPKLQSAVKGNPHDEHNVIL
jgi:hypothetical protein